MKKKHKYVQNYILVKQLILNLFFRLWWDLNVKTSTEQVNQIWLVKCFKPNFAWKLICILKVNPLNFCPIKMLDRTFRQTYTNIIILNFKSRPTQLRVFKPIYKDIPVVLPISTVKIGGKSVLIGHSSKQTNRDYYVINILFRLLWDDC